WPAYDQGRLRSSPSSRICAVSWPYPPRWSGVLAMGVVRGICFFLGRFPRIRDAVQDLGRVAGRGVERDDGDGAALPIEHGQGQLVGVVVGEGARLDPPSGYGDGAGVFVPVRGRVEDPDDAPLLGRPERDEPPELLVEPTALGPPGPRGDGAVQDGPECETDGSRLRGHEAPALCLAAFRRLARHRSVRGPGPW